MPRSPPLPTLDEHKAAKKKYNEINSCEMIGRTSGTNQGSDKSLEETFKEFIRKKSFPDVEGKLRNEAIDGNSRRE